MNPPGSGIPAASPAEIPKAPELTDSSLLTDEPVDTSELTDTSIFTNQPADPTELTELTDIEMTGLESTDKVPVSALTAQTSGLKQGADELSSVSPKKGKHVQSKEQLTSSKTSDEAPFEPSKMLLSSATKKRIDKDFEFLKEKIADRNWQDVFRMIKLWDQFLILTDPGQDTTVEISAFDVAPMNLMLHYVLALPPGGGRESWFSGSLIDILVEINAVGPSLQDRYFLRSESLTDWFGTHLKPEKRIQLLKDQIAGARQHGLTTAKGQVVVDFYDSRKKEDDRQPLPTIPDDAEVLLFPYNPADDHWVAVEARVESKRGNRKNCAIRIYNPIKGRKLELKLGKQELPLLLELIGFLPSSKFNGLAQSNCSVVQDDCPQQQGGEDCGPLTTDTLIHRLKGQSLPQGSNRSAYALNLRLQFSQKLRDHMTDFVSGFVVHDEHGIESSLATGGNYEPLVAPPKEPEPPPPSKPPKAQKLPPPSQLPKAPKSSSAASESATDPLIHMLAVRAETNPRLVDIIKIVATEKATKEQRTYFQSHIDALVESLDAQKKSHQAQKPPVSPSDDELDGEDSASDDDLSCNVDQESQLFMPWDIEDDVAGSDQDVSEIQKLEKLLDGDASDSESDSSSNEKKNDTNERRRRRRQTALQPVPYRTWICDIIEGSEDGVATQASILSGIESRRPDPPSEGNQKERVKLILKSSPCFERAGRRKGKKLWRIKDLRGNSLSTNTLSRLRALPEVMSPPDNIDMIFDLVIVCIRKSWGYPDQKTASRVVSRCNELFRSHWGIYGPFNDMPPEVDPQNPQRGGWWQYIIEPRTSRLPFLSGRSQYDRLTADLLDRMNQAASEESTTRRVLILQNGIDGSSTNVDGWESLEEKWPCLDFHLTIADSPRRNATGWGQATLLTEGPASDEHPSLTSWATYSIEALVRTRKKSNGEACDPLYEQLLVMLNLFDMWKLDNSLFGKLPDLFNKSHVWINDMNRVLRDELHTSRNSINLVDRSTTRKCEICDAPRTGTRWRRGRTSNAAIICDSCYVPPVDPLLLGLDASSIPPDGGPHQKHIPATDSWDTWGTCSECHKQRRISNKEKKLCSTCSAKYVQPIRTCSGCHKEGKTLINKEKNLCRNCYQTQRREKGTCSGCHKEVTIHQRKKNLCLPCYKKQLQTKGTCSGCHEEVTIHQKKKNLCLPCYMKQSEKQKNNWDRIKGRRGKCSGCKKTRIIVDKTENLCGSCHGKRQSAGNEAEERES